MLMKARRVQRRSAMPECAALETLTQTQPHAASERWRRAGGGVPRALESGRGTHAARASASAGALGALVPASSALGGAAGGLVALGLVKDLARGGGEGVSVEGDAGALLVAGRGWRAGGRGRRLRLLEPCELDGGGCLALGGARGRVRLAKHLGEGVALRLALLVLQSEAGGGLGVPAGGHDVLDVRPALGEAEGALHERELDHAQVHSGAQGSHCSAERHGRRESGHDGPAKHSEEAAEVAHALGGDHGVLAGGLQLVGELCREQAGDHDDGGEGVLGGAEVGHPGQALGHESLDLVGLQPHAAQGGEHPDARHELEDHGGENGER
mmetsp:Transcript_16076/g.60829  ORF Transcript_16076/g.60829 Transcript_16076/m.60829 type:complete len:327 (+) Transcript_16076:81-1061(+)